MANRVESQLTEILFQSLQKERFVILSTVDFETGGPNVNALSWVLAKDVQTIYFAVDNRSRIIENINKHKKTVLTLLVDESTFSVSGDAFIKMQKMDDVPLKLALIQMTINEVRDVMFYGSKIVTEPEYDKTYDKKAAERLDHQIMEAMRIK
ncbi:general stress protein 26 [Peribacillus deserti]|uniref:General stress protein 26 n=1 Tax=Peribacillus deserti TaxID=673318 RepID=A0ABS2QGZ4_9BACI|nr:pyridoxamine 5'-phosphate oxidase family protein [Peribacillus deserti]MBM7692413.1 general stress protein 26 [Peribacillus deserti]